MNFDMIEKHVDKFLLRVYPYVFHIDGHSCSCLVYGPSLFIRKTACIGNKYILGDILVR